MIVEYFYAMQVNVQCSKKLGEPGLVSKRGQVKHARLELLGVDQTADFSADFKFCAVVFDADPDQD